MLMRAPKLNSFRRLNSTDLVSAIRSHPNSKFVPFAVRIPKLGQIAAPIATGRTMMRREISPLDGDSDPALDHLDTGCLAIHASARRFAMTVYADALNERPMCVPGTSKSESAFPVKQ
jgi:hypothetical protein